jgi:hypothetical protein
MVAAVAELPAKSLAFNVTVHLPVGNPAMVTEYVTLLPGLFVPVTVIDDEGMAVPFLDALTEVAFRSPSVSVIVAARGVPVVTVPPAAVVKAIVGAEVSMSNCVEPLTKVFAGLLLSVALNWIVLRPDGKVAAMLQTTLLEAAMAALCQ